MVLNDLDSLHANFADFVNESAPPNSSDTRYTSRTRWFNRAREDIAKRWFFKNLLKTDTLEIEAGTPTYTLLEDFEKPNGLYALASSDGSIVYTSPYDTRVLVTISRNFTTGRYEVTFTPTPQEDDSAPYWYFATPPPLVDGTDLVLVDGEAVLYYALKQHFFINGPLDKFAESRDEYENIVEEMSKVFEIPPPGALLGMSNSMLRRDGTTNEKHYYQSSRRRSA